jgi:hypothetical protein
MKATNNPAIDQFIIEASLIDPIQKIINQLKNGEFRDCDLKWLDKKLENFVAFAAKTLNINGVMPQRESVKPTYMNDYAVNYYSKYFNHLLDYFKNL